VKLEILEDIKFKLLFSRLYLNRILFVLVTLTVFIIFGLFNFHSKFKFMPKVRKKATKKSFSKDYQKLMKDFPQTPGLPAAPQWLGNGDFFIKFSLYKDIPSIASTETSLFQC